MAEGDVDDIDAMLEESYQKKEDKHHDERSRSRSREKSSKRSRSKSRDRKRSRSKERRRSRSKDRSSRKDRSRSRDRKKRSRSRDRRRRSRSRERRRSKSPRGFGRGRRSPPRFGGGGRFGRGFGRSRSKSPERPAEPQLTPEERDARTVFVMQLSQRVRARDIEEFFSSVGKIRDVKLIICNKTRRFKGIAYVEFKDIESVTLAMGLAGQKLLGVPVVVQPSQAEKNRAASYGQDMMAANAANGMGNNKGPMRLYVGSLHFNITEEMLQGIFEPFGKIQSIQLIMDQETQRSKGYGFITYHEAEDAKKALEQMNGFELAGRAMKVGTVTERGGYDMGLPGQPAGFKQAAGLDSEAVDKTGIDLGATGRLALMAKLAQGTGMELPQQAASALSQAQAAQAYSHPTQPQNAADHHRQAAEMLAEQQQQQQQQAGGPPIATQCFMLSNMFDPAEESAPNWDQEVRDDVIEEGSKHGGFLHIIVDKASTQGNVYVKCPSVTTAVAAVNALHGRWFAGKVITAAYVPLANYHNLFPDSAYAQQILTTNKY